MGLTILAGSALAQVGTNQDVANPNLAEEVDLSTMPGLNADLAGKVVGARPLGSTGQLDMVFGDALSAEEKATLYATLFVPINLNTASREEIMHVPGINRKMAHEFEEYRPYTSMEQFRGEIGKYVDEDEVARFEQYVFVPMDLNTASGEDFSSIPGMNGRMVHEFEEYRPYTSIEQFRREIGKYVDEDEVARLERYIEIR
jgi:DNA uptake protein ComE-like DNA-binding protein